MSGQNGPDEAARLEAALARIARAFAAQPAPRRDAERGALQVPTPAGGHGDEARPSFTNPSHSGKTHWPAAEIAARLDTLIAELRTVLGTPPL